MKKRLSQRGPVLSGRPRASHRKANPLLRALSRTAEDGAIRGSAVGDVPRTPERRCDTTRNAVAITWHGYAGIDELC